MKRRTAALTITFALAILPTLHRHAIADTAPDAWGRRVIAREQPELHAKYLAGGK